MSVISGPIPAYSNPPIQPQFYQPSRFEITDIEKGLTTIVTTSDANNYVIGQEVRLLVPPEFGMYQINGQQGLVVSLPADDKVEITIDSRFYDDYIVATSNNVPQIVAIGDFNSGIISSTGRVISSTNIPGSFINISPR